MTEIVAPIYIAPLAAMNVLTGNLPPQASFDYVIAAARNHLHGGGK